MSALRDFCIALLGGAVGVGGGVATAPKVKPAIERRLAAKPRPAPERTAPPATPILFDCALPGTAIAAPGALAPPVSDWPGFAPVSGWWDGGWTYTPPPRVQPPTFSPVAAAPVPEVAAWAMLVTGFGLVGASVRRKGRRQT